MRPSPDNPLLSQARTRTPVPAAPTSETIPKPLTKKQIAKKQKELEKELAGPWKKWMNEDVIYIITDEEKQAFKRLED